MITTPAREQAPVTVRARLVSRPLLVRFLSVVGVSVSFYLMLSVVPLFARSAGASTNLAGLMTTALSLSTIAGYLPTPWLVARYGHRLVLAAGMLLLGAPTLVLTVSSNLTVLLAVCVVRGIGFAITCVSGGALTISLIPPERRGEGLALIGVISGVPSVLSLPLGVWLAGHAGFRPVFAIAAVAALAPLASLPWLPAGPSASARSQTRTPSAGMLAGLRTPALFRPSLIFFATTMAVGVFVTFVPLAASPQTVGVDELGLLIQPAASIGGRWLAGRLGDRAAAGDQVTAANRIRGSRLLVTGVLAVAAGLALLGLAGHSPVAVLTGAVLFGTGFGVAQNTSLRLMYDRVPESGFSMVSAMWNLAYDAGMGIGAAGFGVLAGHTGYPVAFALTAALVASASVVSQGAQAR